MEHDDYVTSQLCEVADELIIWFEFYQPRNFENELAHIYYDVRIYEGLNPNRLPKLMELYKRFSKIAYVAFMEEFWGPDEINYGLEDFEVHYAGSLEGCTEDIEAIFELGICWGEYIAMYGPSEPEAYERNPPTLNGELTSELLDRLSILSDREARRKEGQASGAQANSAIGSATQNALKEFVKQNFPDGLDGRSKKSAYLRCATQLERLVKIENKFAGGLSISEEEERERNSLGYLLALTKEKGGKFAPYTLDTIKTKLSPLLKK